MLTYTISELPLPAGADPQASSEGMGVNADVSLLGLSGTPPPIRPAKR